MVVPESHLHACLRLDCNYCLITSGIRRHASLEQDGYANSLSASSSQFLFSRERLKVADVAVN